MSGPSLKPEEELAVACGLLRAALGTDAAERQNWRELAGRIGLGRLEALVRRHRIGSFLARRLPKEVVAMLPAGSAGMLSVVGAETARGALARAGEVVRLTRACAEAGLPVLSMKGVVLAQQLYGDLMQRHAGDIDLLFHPSQVEAADGVLRTCGYRRTRPDFELTARQHHEYLTLKPEFEYWSAAACIRVELHWRLEGLDEAEIWRKPERCRLGGCEIGTLPWALNVRYLCEHGARHGWFRLFWLVDVALLLRENRTDWTEVMAAARRAGTERALAQAAVLAEELLGATARPEWVSREPAECRRIARLVAEARRHMQIPESGTAGGVREWARQLRYRAALQRTGFRKWAMVRPHVYSPLGWSMVRLPDRWFWLYGPLTPFLWLGRRLLPKKKSNR